MSIEVLLAQFNPTTGDLSGNTESILETIRRAERADVDLVVFPEMAVTGYCIRDLIEDDTFIDENLAALNRIQEETTETAVVVGFVDRDGDDKYNAAAVLQHGERQGVTRKSLLPNYRYFDDERYFEAAEEIEPIRISIAGDPVELGVSICEDMWDGEYDRAPISELAASGADILININASPFETGKRATRHEIIRRHVEETGLPFLYVNTVGVADVEKNIIVFDGDSLAYRPDGTLLAKGGQFEAEELQVEVPHDTRDVAFTENADIETVRREKELYRALVTGIRDYTRKTGFERILEPVSGGIDSSLGLALCADALGSENVLAFNLPSEVNTDTTRTLAERLADNFGVEYRTIPIQSIYDETLAAYESNYGEIQTDVAKQNVYARIRGLLMMLVSNESRTEASAMLVSNGNKTEMGLGYVTLYGDMDGGLDILGDLSKMDVYDVARYVNERHGEELIPEETFEIEPSAELEEDQTDPFDYPIVSPLIDDLLQHRVDPAELVSRFENHELDTDRYQDAQGTPVYDYYDVDAFEATVYDTYDRLTNSTFKRVQSPPIIAVSGRAFGTDFREPIINEWNGRPIDWNSI